MTLIFCYDSQYTHDACVADAAAPLLRRNCTIVALCQRLLADAAQRGPLPSLPNPSAAGRAATATAAAAVERRRPRQHGQHAGTRLAVSNPAGAGIIRVDSWRQRHQIRVPRRLIQCGGVNTFFVRPHSTPKGRCIPTHSSELHEVHDGHRER